MLGIAIFFLVIHTLDLGLVLGNKTAAPSVKATALLIDLVSVGLAITAILFL